MKISFDYDGTLTNAFVSKMARKFQMDGHDVYIITTRRTYLPNGTKLDNSEVFKKAKQLCISPKNVIFTEYEWKADKLNYLDIDIHFDDNNDELLEYDARGYSGCKIIKI